MLRRGKGIIAAMHENHAAGQPCRGRRDGRPLAWWRHGRAQAPEAPLLLIHGLASNASRWAEFAEASTLPPRRALLRVDLRGHGQAQPAPPATTADWIGDLAATLDAEGAARAVVVGHSLGAQVALQFAARRPQRVEGLVLIDPVFRPALAPRWARIAALAPLFRAAALVIGALNRLGLRRRRVVPDDLRELDRQAREALRDPAAEAAFIARYSSTRHDLAQMRSAQYLQDLVEMFRPTPPLEGLAMPVLALLSTGATFADAAAMRRLLAALPDGEVQAVQCHHWPLTERPDAVREAVEDWVRRRFPAAA